MTKRIRTQRREGNDKFIPVWLINDFVVYPKPHTDKGLFITGPEEHYHVDDRFVDGPHAPSFRASVVKPTRGKRKMVRTTPRVDYTQTTYFRIALYAKYEADWAKFKGCKLCPHKGLPVHNGVCGGHRLEFDAVPPFRLYLNEVFVGLLRSRIEFGKYRTVIKLTVPERIERPELFLRDAKGKLLVGPASSGLREPVVFAGDTIFLGGT